MPVLRTRGRTLASTDATAPYDDRPRCRRRSRCCRPAARPAARSWCTTGRASTRRSSTLAADFLRRRVPAAAAPVAARRCGWPAGRSPASSTCSPAGCCSCATPGTPAAFSATVRARADQLDLRHPADALRGARPPGAAGADCSSHVHVQRRRRARRARPAAPGHRAVRPGAAHRLRPERGGRGHRAARADRGPGAPGAAALLRVRPTATCGWRSATTTGRCSTPAQTARCGCSSKLSFAGYHGQPELTAETLVDGWVRTRDLGHLDADGYLYLVDRVHDMIVTHPPQLGDLLPPDRGRARRRIPQVRAAAVIGVPDQVVGEAVARLRGRRRARRSPRRSCIDLVTDELNEMWAPRGVEFVDELPLTRSRRWTRWRCASWYADRARGGRRSAAPAEPVAAGWSPCSPPTCCPPWAPAISMVAIPWLVLVTTGSPAKMGLVAAREMLPYILSSCWRPAGRTGSGCAVRRSSPTSAARSRWRRSRRPPGSGSARCSLLVAVAGALRGVGDRVKHVLVRPMAEAAEVQLIRLTSLHEAFARGATLLGAPLGGLLIYWIGRGVGALDRRGHLRGLRRAGRRVRPPARRSPTDASREQYFRALRGGFCLRPARRLLAHDADHHVHPQHVRQREHGGLHPALGRGGARLTGRPRPALGAFSAGALLGNIVFTVLAPAAAVPDVRGRRAHRRRAAAARAGPQRRPGPGAGGDVPVRASASPRSTRSSARRSTSGSRSTCRPG